MKNKLKVVNVRLVNEPTLYSTKEVKCSDDVIELMKNEIAGYDREVVCVLNLKTNSQVISMNVVSIGTLSSCLVCARELFKCSILSNSAKIIMVHNHPSGNIIPSEEDISVTKKMNLAGSILGIELLDHIIIGGITGESFSFRENKLIDDHMNDDFQHFWKEKEKHVMER